MKERLYRDLLPKVAKPARYSGGEFNMIRKDWQTSLAKMVLAFPDVYEVGMSHVGSKILYGLVNEKSSHLLERAYAPWPDMEKVMRSGGIPLYTLESFRPLSDFDIIGFSLQYELSITNVLNMLALSGIPLRSRERDDKHPLIIAGGPVAFNPEPFADFFDLFIIGDGEEVLLELLDKTYELRGRSKKEKLLNLSVLEGVYAPALYKAVYEENGSFASLLPQYPEARPRVRKRVVRDLDRAYFPECPIVPHLSIIHDRAVLEVMRGCQRGCRFCQAGMVYRPVRERSRDLLLDQAKKQLKSTGYEEISLASLSTLDYSGVLPLVKELISQYQDKGVGVALPSLRVDAFSVELANEVQKVRKTTLTLAPEAATQRLRDVINKNVSEEELFQAVEAAFKSGWLALKLYFMLGLPGETDEDLLAVHELLTRVRSIGNHHAQRGAGHHPQVGVVLRGQHDGGNLGLVAHLGQEERHQRGAEHAPAGLAIGIAFVELVGDQHPHRHGDERGAQNPAQHLRADEGRDPGSHRASQSMVDQRGHQNAQNNRPGFAETGCQYQCEQLGFIAHLGQGDDGG